MGDQLSINQELRNMRIARRITMSRAAQLAGYSAATLQRIECGNVAPKYETVMRLKSIYSGVDEPSPVQPRVRTATLRIDFGQADWAQPVIAIGTALIALFTALLWAQP